MEQSETLAAVVNHWDEFHRLWSRLRPPQRPNAEVAAAVRAAIAGSEERVLLLGVTQELAGIGSDLTAVDHNQTMIERIWRMNDPSRRVIKGDWLELPFAAGQFSAVIGDGSLSCVPHPEGQRKVLCELARVLRPGGKYAVRAFARAERCQTPGQVCMDAMAGKAGTFHAFKWRLAMSLAAQVSGANVPVAKILETFNEYLPDRAAVAVAAGWDMEDFTTIDIYAGSVEVYSFASRSEVESCIGGEFVNVRWVESGSYDLCECCPLLTMERAAT